MAVPQQRRSKVCASRHVAKHNLLQLQAVSYVKCTSLPLVCCMLTYVCAVPLGRRDTVICANSTILKVNKSVLELLLYKCQQHIVRKVHRYPLVHSGGWIRSCMQFIVACKTHHSCASPVMYHEDAIDSCDCSRDGKGHHHCGNCHHHTCASYWCRDGRRCVYKCSTMYSTHTEVNTMYGVCTVVSVWVSGLCGWCLT